MRRLITPSPAADAARAASGNHPPRSDPCLLCRDSPVECKWRGLIPRYSRHSLLRVLLQNRDIDLRRLLVVWECETLSARSPESKLTGGSGRSRRTRRSAGSTN